MRRTGLKLFHLFALSSFLVLFLAATSLAAPDPPLLSRAKQLQDDLLRDLETLVNIDSPSGYGAGSERIMMILSEKLQALGGRCILPEEESLQCLPGRCKPP